MLVSVTKTSASTNDTLPTHITNHPETVKKQTQIQNHKSQQMSSINFREEFLVGASHQLVPITPDILPVAHTD